MKVKQNTDKPKSHRVFFALWPDDDVRKQISKTFKQSSYAKQDKGHRYKSNNLHITLHFLGNITTEQLHCVQYQAMDIKVRPFKLNIDHYGIFKRAGVLWLGASEVPDELRLLQLQLGEALKECDYQIEQREYKPHITLMRKYHRNLDESSISPIEWEINRFALIESVPVEGGVEYHPIGFYD